MGKFGYMAIAFIANIVLARILNPEEFGILAIAFFFIAISNVLVESGLGGALVRDKDATETDYSTIFIFNLGVSVILYVALFSFSWKIETYYGISNLSFYLKILGLILIINAFKIIQNVRLVKALNYKKISLFNIISITIATIIGIIIAVLGYGVWALILLQVVNALVSTILFWSFEKNITIFVFSKNSFKKLYGFGLFTTLSSILDTIFDNVYQLILGKYFNLNQTGYYYQAKKLTEIPVGIIKSTSISVVFSALSNIQDDKDKFDKLYSNIVRVFTVIVGIICLLIFIYSKELLQILYGEEWIPASFYMKILAIAYFFYMQEMFNRNIFKVFNKTHKIFVLEVIKKSILAVSIFIGIFFKDIEVLMYGFMVSYIISYYINYYVSRTVYKSTSTFLEMSYTIKTIASAVTIGGVIELMKLIYPTNSLNNLFYLPIVISGYLLLLKFLKVINVSKDLVLIRNLVK